MRADPGHRKSHICLYDCTRFSHKIINRTNLYALCTAVLFLNAKSALSPKGKIFIPARMQLFHSGHYARFAFRPKCKNHIQGIRSAKTAFLLNAEFALLLSAENARDSINYLKTLLITTLKEMISILYIRECQTIFQGRYNKIKQNILMDGSLPLQYF